jgi:hypothetical protein
MAVLAAESTPLAAPGSRVPRAAGLLRRYWWVLLVLVVLAARRPDAFANPQFWAEDAVVFHADAEIHGLGSLSRPVAGYHLLIPRLVALGSTSWFDARWHPAAFNYAAVAVVLLVCATLGTPRWSGPPPVLCGLAMVLVGQADEIFVSLTSVQWVTMLAIVVCCAIRPPESIAGRSLEAAALLAVGLTGPFSVVLWPLAAIRVWIHGRPALPSFCALTAAALIQSATLLTVPGGPAASEELARAPWSRIISFRLFVQTFLPNGYRPESVEHQLAFAVAIAGAAGAAALYPGPNRRLRATMLVAAVLVQTATALRMDPIRDVFLLGGENGPRYFYGARVLLAWLFLTLAAGAFPRALRAVGVVCVAAWLLSAAAAFRIPPLHDLHWGRYAPAVRAGRAIDIPVNPVPWMYHYPGRPGDAPQTPSSQ